MAINANLRSRSTQIMNLMELLSSSTSKPIITSSSSTLGISQVRDAKVNQCAELIVDFVLDDEYIEGQTSKSQLYIENLYYQDPQVLKDSFQKAWLNIYSHGEHAMFTFISIASSIRYEWLEDRADTLIFAGYCHASGLVNEATIRAVESWEQPGHIALLKEMKPLNILWLEEYKQNVIRYLETL
ncbi:hypothetical protein FJD32_000800 [Shewanella sp. LC6]|uniref:hypothetical protein n=1 Tax=Shewanella TaxID=22 RepID=UPI0006E2B475|nr:MULTISPECIES: hypothetical protein [Shewanella]MDH1468508.1 hypothetical protein [Shewanella sp. GD03713]QQK58161.1 hypothetical protein FJD32_000800 [Shewanella sp. LC6]TPE65490.1 hypothetical protein FJD33_00515 [Shewanella sp. LC2]